METPPETSLASRPAGPSRRSVLLARMVFGLTLVAIATGIVLKVADRGTDSSWGVAGFLADFGFVVGFGAFPVVGYVLATRRPENPISWLLLAIGAAFGLDSLLGSYGSYAIHGGLGGAHTGEIAVALDSPLWVPLIVLPATFLILLFPDGHLPSPRWRWFARILGAGFAIFCVPITIGPGKLSDSGFPNLVNPIGVEALRPLLEVLTGLILLVPIGVVGSLVSLRNRYKHSTGVERLQLRWLVSAATVVGVVYTIVLLLSWNSAWGNSAPTWLQIVQNTSVIAFGLFPLAIGVSILRYRLFEIDLVINRALLFGALAVFITAVYVAIVVGIGAIIGTRADPILSAVAAAVVALAFQPARRRAQRFADRLVYGKRATPYEVLSEVSDQLETAYANEDLLPRMVRALGEGTGAARADVWVRIGGELRGEATWPQDAGLPAAIPASALESLESFESSTTSSSMVEPVRHRGELLGALGITKKPGDSIAPTEEKLVRDLAAQAGLVMRNVALTEQLMENIEQLRASRQRLVNAQDEERRKLERNLHDGAQQQLVALAVKLRLVEQLIERDTTKARSMAAELQTDAADALEELRDLARGIYPPLLADQGLVAALESQARKSIVPVTVEGNGVGRYPREAEAAIYFSCLEALQNVGKYANASTATLRLSDGDGRLRFEVSDDGVGFDPASTGYGTGLQGIADRLAAVGGAVQVRSSPGAGTTVEGDLPTTATGPER